MNLLRILTISGHSRRELFSILGRKKVMAGKRSILIAEDDYFNFVYLEKLLKDAQVNIFWAKNGMEAIDICKKNPSIDLILMDIRMPGISGIEALQQIRLINKNVPVVAQTAYSLDDESLMIQEAGFTDYITKPIRRPDLLRKLAFLLEGSAEIH